MTTKQAIPPPGPERDRLIAEKLGIVPCEGWQSHHAVLPPALVINSKAHEAHGGGACYNAFSDPLPFSTDLIAFTRLRLWIQKELRWDFNIYAAAVGDTAVTAFRVGANRMSRAQNKDEADAGTRAILEAMG